MNFICTPLTASIYKIFSNLIENENINEEDFFKRMINSFIKFKTSNQFDHYL